MLIKRANLLAEIKIFLYISQERLQETFRPGFVSWAIGFNMSTSRTSWQTEVRLFQIEVRDQ